MATNLPAAASGRNAARGGRVVALLLLAQLLGFLPTVGTAAAATESTSVAPRPGLTVGLVDAPADPDDPRAVVYIVGHHQPGDVIRRVVEVANGDDEAMQLRMGVAEAEATDEWNVPGALGQGDVAAWTTIVPERFELAAGQRRRVEVTITIPADAVGGQRHAAVLAERETFDGNGTRVLNRVGVRTYLSVGGAAAPVADFVIDTMRPLRTAAGEPAVWIRVTNTGEQVLDIAGILTLRDGPGSLTAGPFPVVVPRTLGAGFSGDVVVALDPSLPVGPWLAVAELSGGPVQRQAQARITFPVAQSPVTGPNGEQLGDAVPASPLLDRGLLVPINLALLLAAIVSLLLLFWRRRRKHEDDEAALELGAPSADRELVRT